MFFLLSISGTKMDKLGKLVACSPLGSYIDNKPLHPKTLFRKLGSRQEQQAFACFWGPCIGNMSVPEYSCLGFAVAGLTLRLLSLSISCQCLRGAGVRITKLTLVESNHGRCR